MEDNNLKGLSSSEIKKLRAKYGLNELVKNKKPNPLMNFLGVFKEPMFILLLGAALIYFVLGEPKEAIIMLTFVIFVASITFMQEWKTEKTMEALKELTSPQVKVIRDGKENVIKSSELLPGDIVIIAEGERIPADCEVIYASNFSVDESILTGEAETVYKISRADIVPSEDDNTNYWKPYIIYAGTLSIFGKCTARVLKIGFETEYGKISKSISETKEGATPLQKKIKGLVKSLAITGFFLCSSIIAISYFYNGKIIESILTGITLAMAIIPEEFPVVLTVFLSLGAFRLAKKNTLIRKINAVETLGSASVLCVDKTGTITKNQMEVRELYSDNKFFSPNHINDLDFARLMVMSCEQDPYDPMEKAIVSSAYNCSYKTEDFLSSEIALRIPFDNATKRMANIYVKEEAYYVAAKGAPEAILPLCCLNDKESEEVLHAIDKMAEKGLRVLAFASVTSYELCDNLNNYKLTFRGLVGLQDPPKEGVKDAIKICTDAGIRVMMITGDYSKTAMAIGKDIGLKFKDCTITGEDIESMTDEELAEAVKHCDIFSRVVPNHKMKIVKALKGNGDIVAMTGDGVNDAPALKNADIGIAMGKRGTQVAKEASHMILLDDNFTTIVESVKDGRRIFDNIRKAMVYIMVIHIPIILLALFSTLLNLPAILLPAHIMLLELIIDPTCSIIFEAGEAEPNIMKQPPRSSKEPLLTKSLTIKVLLQGISMFLAAFIPFHYLVDSGFGVELARSFSLVTLIISNIILVLVNCSNAKYVFTLFKQKSNNVRILINVTALVMVIAVVYIPFLQGLFYTKALNLSMLLLSIGLGIVSSLWWELVKLVTNTISNQHVILNKNLGR